MAIVDPVIEILASTGQSILTATVLMASSDIPFTLTDVGDVRRANGSFLFKNPMCTLPDASRPNDGTTLDRTDDAHTTLTSPNGVWSATVAQSSVSIRFHPLFSERYQPRSYELPSVKVLQDLQAYCMATENSHVMCGCSRDTRDAQDQCIRKLGIDPTKLSTSARSVIASQCPCLNVDCGVMFQRHRGTHYLFDMLGPIGTTYGLCPSSAITTICTNNTVLNDSEINTTDNQIAQNCGVQSTVGGTITDSGTSSGTGTGTSSGTGSGTGTGTGSSSDSGSWGSSVDKKNNTQSSSRAIIFVGIGILIVLLFVFLMWNK